MKNAGKIRILTIILTLLFSFSGLTAFAAAPITVTYNNSILVCDVSPYIENSRTLIPIRMAEQLGYNVLWDSEARKVTLTKADKSIILTIDSNTAIVNGSEVKMDTAAKIKSDRTFVPIRFISENFGYNVSWNNSSRTVAISDSGNVNITNITTERSSEKLLVKLFADSLIDSVDSFALDSPLRYVYDIKGANLNISNAELPINSAAVKSVRFSQYSVSPATVRVVVELNSDTSVTAGYSDGIYVISVADGDVPTVTSLKLNEGSNNASVVITTDMTVSYKTYKLSNPSRYIVELPDSDIAAPDAVGSGSVVEKAALERKNGATSLVIYLAGAVSATKCSVSQSGGSITVTAEKSFSEASGTVNDDFLIVIDPGHGGDEPGSLGKINDKIVLYEKDVNLKIGKRVYEILLEKGYNVIATRTDDSTVSLQRRVEIANESNADLFVSVHNNSFSESSAKGTLTMYAFDTPKSGQTYSGKQIASIIQPHLVNATSGYDRKLMENSKIYVNARTNMPAVLCECLFMSNPEDLAKLMDDSWCERIANGIADGICEAVSLMKS